MLAEQGLVRIFANRLLERTASGLLVALRAGEDSLEIEAERFPFRRNLFVLRLGSPELVDGEGPRPQMEGRTPATDQGNRNGDEKKCQGTIGHSQHALWRSITAIPGLCEWKTVVSRIGEAL